MNLSKEAVKETGEPLFLPSQKETRRGEIFLFILKPQKSSTN
jgi:hypothetical protein